MSVSQADKYYLQALDSYGFDIGETIEALNYALSHDNEHAGAHCMLGRIHMDQLKQFDVAEEHFQQALICDARFVTIYELYSLLLIYLKEFEKAKKLIEHAYTLRGINFAVMYHREGLLYEYQGEYSQAQIFMDKAFNFACNEEDRNFLKMEVERVKEKQKSTKEKVEKKKKKKKKSKTDSDSGNEKVLK